MIKPNQVLLLAMTFCLLVIIFCLYSVKASSSNGRAVSIVNHGWHTSIVIQSKDIPVNLIPERELFSKNRFIEIGWGDAGFYQAKEITTPLIIKALFRPSKSVVHISGFDYPPSRYFPKSEVSTIRFSKENYVKLLKFLHDSIDRQGQKIALPFRRGLYGDSYFFKGIGDYHLLRTCNKWTAEAIEIAGYPVSSQLVTTADSLIQQLRKGSNTH